MLYHTILREQATRCLRRPRSIGGPWLSLGTAQSPSTELARRPGRNCTHSLIGHMSGAAFDRSRRAARFTSRPGRRDGLHRTGAGPSGTRAGIASTAECGDTVPTYAKCATARAASPNGAGSPRPAANAASIIRLAPIGRAGDTNAGRKAGTLASATGPAPATSQTSKHSAQGCCSSSHNCSGPVTKPASERIPRRRISATIFARDDGKRWLAAGTCGLACRAQNLSRRRSPSGDRRQCHASLQC
jgi:hypothetical protein